MSAIVTVETPNSVQVYHLPNLLDKDLIKAGQDHIRETLADLDLDIHANAVQCLMHAEKHGDTSLMRRLLIEIIPDKNTGYRRQGIIAWMRHFSPMELSKDNINLSGTLPDGTRRPFDIAGADQTPFWTNRKFDEALAWRPVYKDVLMSQVRKAIKDFKASVANTEVEGGVNRPIDPKKPFYRGLHMDKMTEAFFEIGKTVTELSTWQDKTKDFDDAKAAMAKAQKELEEAAAA